MQRKGFTLIEIIIVIGITALLFTIAFQTSSLLEAQGAVRNHRVVGLWLMDAAQRARGGVQGGDWGIFFVQIPGTQAVEEIVLFQGETYATRDTSQDIALSLSEDISFTLSFQNVAPYTGSGAEVVFEENVGDPHQTGTVTMTTRGITTVITIPSSGVPTLER